MPEGPPPEALLILGMHRSGTSALARVVNLLGAQLGSRLLEPQTGVNAQGFWEHADVVSGHEALLGDLDSAWYDVRPLPVNWEDGAAAQRLEEHLARLLESDFSAHPLIAVKDPRLCRFVASWKRVLQRAGRRAKFVLILRDPEEVVRSLHRRDGLDQSTVRMMWLVYVLEAERATRDDPRSIVFYDELLTDWETTVDRIAGELDLRWPVSTGSARAQVEQELRSDLRHHVTSDVDRETADALAARCREVYDDLKNDPAGAGTLDPHWSWLAALRENSGELAEAMFRANQQFVARTAEWMLRTDEAQELQTQLDESRTRIRDLQVELARSIEERHALRQRQIDTEVAGGPPPIDVIVPVYRGLDELKRCLGSVLTQRQRVPYELVVVDDRSPEPEISAYLDELAARDMRVTLLRNETNLGFPATVNRGMSLHPGRDVVLLNSDTEVANDWLDRLARCARRADDIATVTPFTNNGTICSYPNFCRDNAPTAGMTTGEVDASFAAVNAGRAVEVPTAVGFCMYIRRACLDQVGMFDDKTFGAGYGEENEFCMRARRLGWKHLHCGDTFVFHSGAASFGLEKDMRVHAALEKLNAIHPQYKALVQRHIADDPAAGMRLAARIAITKRNRAPVVLFVSHREGGGTETHIRELSAYLHEQVQVIVLRPDAGRRVALSLGPESDSDRLLFDLRSEYDELLTVCKALGVRRLHVHHVLGWPGKLHGLAGDLGVPLDVTVHDYYFINANPTLTDTRGRFCAAQRDRDRRCAEAYPIPGGATPQRWRAQQSELLRAADRVIAPSDYTARLVEEAFPGLDVIRAYHPDRERRETWSQPRAPVIGAKDRLRVMVVGALSPAKGADLLEACALGAAQRGLPLDFRLIGYAYRRLDPAVDVSGPYRDEQLHELIRQARPHVIWFPAQWPETYNYCLSAALTLRVPIIAPDIGAFPERLAGRPLTWIEPWDLEPPQWLELFGQIRRDLVRGSAAGSASRVRTGSFTAPASEFRYRTDYVPRAAPVPAPLDPDGIHRLVGRLTHHRPHVHLSRRERAVLVLNAIRHAPVLGRVSRLVPRRVQAAVRLRLSHRPIEELLLKG
jgi:GT2 family glycosyltransferase/glycosyltransferase involved in cell wall biosynthesis